MLKQERKITKLQLQKYLRKERQTDLLPDFYGQYNAIPRNPRRFTKAGTAAESMFRPRSPLRNSDTGPGYPGPPDAGAVPLRYD